MSAKHRRRPEVAGAMLTPESIESPAAERKMIGSLLIIEAKDMEEVRAMVENDIYYTSGVVSFIHQNSSLLDAEARIVGYRETRHIAFPAYRAAPLTDKIPLNWFRGGSSLQRSLKDSPNTRSYLREGITIICCQFVLLLHYYYTYTLFRLQDTMLARRFC